MLQVHSVLVLRDDESFGPTVQVRQVPTLQTWYQVLKYCKSSFNEVWWRLSRNESACFGFFYQRDVKCHVLAGQFLYQICEEKHGRRHGFLHMCVPSSKVPYSDITLGSTADVVGVVRLFAFVTFSHWSNVLMKVILIGPWNLQQRAPQKKISAEGWAYVLKRVI